MEKNVVSCANLIHVRCWLVKKSTLNCSSKLSQATTLLQAAAVADSKVKHKKL